MAKTERNTTIKNQSKSKGGRVAVCGGDKPLKIVPPPTKSNSKEKTSK